MQSRALGIVPRTVARVVTDAPRVLTGVAVEAGWTAAHLAMYPFGLIAEPTGLAGRRHSLDGLSPAARGLVHAGVDEAMTPILLVHGIIDNHSIFSVMGRTLRRRGFHQLSSFDYGLLTSDITQAAEQLGDAIEKLAANNGYPRIHVIGHSLGGLIARYYVQRRGGDATVHTLVTLGTPHQGTALARSLPLLPLIRQLTPQSPLIRELAEPAPGCRTRFLAFHSDLDHIVGPSRNAMVLHPDLMARNIAVHGVGHLSMPHNSRIAFQIATALRELDQGQPAAGPPTS